MTTYRLVLALLLFGCAAPTGDADDPGTAAALQLTEELRIDAETADLSRVGYMLVNANGDILVTQGADGVIKVFEAGGAVRTVGRAGEGPGEFTNLTRIGWLGDTLWALDPGLRRVSLFSPDLEYARSFPQPIGIHDGTPSPEEESEPNSVFVQAVLNGGDLRVTASFRPARRPAWAEGLDSGTTALMRIGVDGLFRHILALRQPDPCVVSFAIGERGSGSTRIPFCSRQLDTSWEGGDDVVLVNVAEPVEANGSYRVTRIAASGDTVFSREFGYTPTTVTQSAIDSLSARMEQAYANLPSQARAAMPRPDPAPYFGPLRGLLLGRDGSVWLEEHSLTPGHHWLILDATGEPVGRVSVPANFRLMTAELGTLWGLEADEDGLESIVRYRVD